MKKFFNDTALMLWIQNVLLAILMVFGAFLVYILSDGGSVQSVFNEIRQAGFEFTLIGVYMVISSVMINSSSFRQASFDEEDNNEKIQKYQKLNAELNDSLDDVRYINEFVDYYNKEEYARLQKEANDLKIRRLKSKLYSLDLQYKFQKINLQLNRETNKLKRLPLKIKKWQIKRQKDIEKKIALIESGKANAPVKNYKPIARKDFTSVELESKNYKNGIKLRSNTKRKTLARSLVGSMFVNFFASFGVIIALQSLFDYNFAQRGIALAIFVIFYIIALIAKYLINYVSNRRAFKNDSEEVLKNRHDLLKKCKGYVNKHYPKKPTQPAEIEQKQETNTNPPQLANA